MPYNIEKQKKVVCKSIIDRKCLSRKRIEIHISWSLKFLCFCRSLHVLEIDSYFYLLDKFSTNTFFQFRISHFLLFELSIPSYRPLTNSLFQASKTKTFFQQLFFWLHFKPQMFIMTTVVKGSRNPLLKTQKTIDPFPALSLHALYPNGTTVNENKFLK